MIILKLYKQLMFFINSSFNKAARLTAKLTINNLSYAKLK